MIDQNNEQVGVIERDQALRLAQDAGLDLVEIKHDVRPPICKIMDFGQYKYELSKKKKNTKPAETKEIRLGRSVRIDQHDIAIRVAQARKFLMEQHKVVVTQRFRGREMAHPQIVTERLDKIAKDLSDISRLTSPPKMAGRQMSMMLAPDKAKIEAIKRQLAKEAARSAKQSAEEPVEEKVETPVEASAEAPVENSVENPVEALVEQPASENAAPTA